MLAKISKADAKWLLEVYAPMRKYRIDNGTLGTYLKAYNLMKGTERVIKCSSCEGRALAAMANSMFEQYQTEIEQLIQPKKGRKKNGTTKGK